MPSARPGMCSRFISAVTYASILSRGSAGAAPPHKGVNANNRRALAVGRMGLEDKYKTGPASNAGHVIRWLHADRACSRPCEAGDRKSTRLNSSHLVISYAVFCLKKKKHTKTRLRRTFWTTRQRRNAHANTR